jgi:tRNA A-37 threonylcarbamoyl transferase component Bud32
VELVATERARRAGVRVPEVLAGWFRPRFPFGHEGWLLTREIEGSRDLVDLFSAGEPAGPALRRLGEETRRMHAAGVWHADLHVKNVLLVDGEVTIIDFDRAQVLDPVPEPARVGNLLRFDRSVVKLARSGVEIPLRDRLRFFHGYRDGPVERAARAEVIRRCRKSLARHGRWWSLAGTGRK